MRSARSQATVCKGASWNSAAIHGHLRSLRGVRRRRNTSSDDELDLRRGCDADHWNICRSRAIYLLKAQVRRQPSRRCVRGVAKTCGRCCRKICSGFCCRYPDRNDRPGRRGIAAPRPDIRIWDAVLADIQVQASPDRKMPPGLVLIGALTGLLVGLTSVGSGSIDGAVTAGISLCSTSDGWH
jgi:hypothetical protein